ncbi:uncharacterized protein BDR25DRAFT_356309 [Lindgomyces ingoldianus]|uniref:Uncharacterized protein n=1 Tax=Lindgomyces ingoldianus TaxID=673940 RepID=A0ACB6QRV6_9PLEO|nr:uncharacterized protein BDR25DRAFT_356309 [Lindgomyces ingoldianus]KAF2469577.1 hypothetical protein BDR25DRAFT_356309 [Lindgomyces ingoldianus]
MEFRAQILSDFAVGEIQFFLPVLLLASTGSALLKDRFPDISGTKSFNTSKFWDVVANHCPNEITALSACPPANESPKLRTPFATSYSQFLISFRFDAYFSCSGLGDYEKQVPIPTGFIPVANFSSQSGCNYPAPLPVLRDACTFDAEEIPRSGCCSQSSSSCGQQNTNLLICQMQARQLTSSSAEQYVRCTNAQSSTPGSNSTLCVIENAEKATWLPKQFLVFSGSSTCPTAHKVLTYLAISNLIAFVSALLSNTQVWKTLFRRSKAYEYTDIKLNFLSMFISIGTHIAIPFIMGVILEKQGYTVNWIQQVLLWTVRPRIAPIIAILGFINASWMEIAINEMVADLLFCIPATNFAVFAAFFPNKTKNPAKPDLYKIYHAGGIIMLIPGVILTFTLLVSFCLKCAPIRAFKYPFQDLWRLVSNPFRKLMKKEQLEKRTVHISVFKGWFIIFFFLGIILYVGSWMVWASFLKMAGELYCPAKLNKIGAVLFAYPVVLNALRVGNLDLGRAESCMYILTSAIDIYHLHTDSVRFFNFNILSIYTGLNLSQILNPELQALGAEYTPTKYHLRLQPGWNCNPLACIWSRLYPKFREKIKPRDGGHKVVTTNCCVCQKLYATPTYPPSSLVPLSEVVVIIFDLRAASHPQLALDARRIGAGCQNLAWTFGPHPVSKWLLGHRLSHRLAATAIDIPTVILSSIKIVPDPIETS